MYRRVLRMAQVVLAFAAVASAGNLIVNGGFEVLAPDSTGWTITDPDGDGSTRVLCGNNDGAVGHGGSGCYVWGGEILPFGNEDAATVSQTGIPVLANELYTLSFYLQNFPDTIQNPDQTVNNEMELYWNGKQIDDQVNIPISSAYTLYTYTVNGSDGNGSGTLLFQLNNPPGALLLDDVSLEDTGSSTPEPATLYTGIGAFLLAIGMAKRGSVKRA